MIVRFSREKDFTTRKSHVSLPRTQPFKRISQGTFSRERSQLLYPRVTTVALLFINSTPSEVSAIPCVLFGNPLRALFLKNRDFFCHGVIFVTNTRGPLGCLLGFWPSGPKPCGGNFNKANLFDRSPYVLSLFRSPCYQGYLSYPVAFSFPLFLSALFSIAIGKYISNI